MFLERNINIYEHELKERKILYEKLALEKNKMEKETLLERKIKSEIVNHQ